MSLREIILNTASDAGLDFAVYDRKEDEELSHRALMVALETGDVTIEEIGEAFTRAVQDSL